MTLMIVGPDDSRVEGDWTDMPARRQRLVDGAPRGFAVHQHLRPLAASAS